LTVVRDVHNSYKSVSTLHEQVIKSCEVDSGERHAQSVSLLAGSGNKSQKRTTSTTTTLAYAHTIPDTRVQGATAKSSRNMLDQNEKLNTP